MGVIRPIDRRDSQLFVKGKLAVEDLDALVAGVGNLEEIIRNHRIMVFGTDGSLIQSIGGLLPGTENRKFNCPKGLTVGP
ncbi:MAG: hypothetical protein ACM3PY_18815, partial [Omnitrophica WOR_2 bacterium]